MLCSMAACARAMKLPPVPINAKRLILVRHGSVDRAAHDPPIPDGALYGGNLEVPLSAKGEEEAAAAADLIGEFAREFAPDAISLIASSPMKRAMYGAERIREAVSPHRIGGVGIQSYELFKEIDRGEWVNLTREQIEEKWGKDAFDRSVLEPEYGRTFGGEGMGDLTERVLTARDHVLRGVRRHARTSLI
jgi:broad specificity phosphatase PhoE